MSETVPEPDGDTPDEPEADDQRASEPDDTADTDWKAEADKWRSLSRKHEKDAKANAAAAKRLVGIEESAKTEQEKAADKAAAAEALAAQRLERMVRAEVRALAADTFADPADAALYLDLSKYATDGDDELDTEAIKADLVEVLERKPHLRKQQPPQKKATPKPDASQGAKATGAQRPISLNEAVARAFAPK